MSIAGNTGERYGMLVTQSRASGAQWFCVCDCGGFAIKSIYMLRHGHVQSCGCLKRGPKPTHGHTNKGRRSPTLHSFTAMRTRCYNKKHARYNDYGGRGITVCERWNKFENFLADMGVRPVGTSLDRIDNDLSYTPTNCRWATRAEQGQNRRPRAIKK